MYRDPFDRRDSFGTDPFRRHLERRDEMRRGEGGSSSRSLFGRKSLFVIGGILVVVLLCSFAYVFGTEAEKEITVKKLTHKIKTSSSGQKDEWQVHTTDGDVYKVTDTLFRGRFDSSSLMAQLTEGQTYRIKYYGWRIPFLSEYPNILEAKPLVATKLNPKKKEK